MIDYGDVEHYWAGLSLLERLSVPGAELSSEDVCSLLGGQSVKGIGAALSGTRGALSVAGIRMDEAVVRKTVRRRSLWTAGPRIRQAMHVLEQERFRWMASRSSEVLPTDDPTGPALVLRALKSRGDVYRIDGGMAELNEIMKYWSFDADDPGTASIGEIFIARIETGDGGQDGMVPDGYGENGIWVRGKHDYAEPRVPGAIGTGTRPVMIAWIGEATWVERRLPLGDMERQVALARAEHSWLMKDTTTHWRDVEPETRFRYVRWIAALRPGGSAHTPPLHLRLRCWYEIVISMSTGKRVVLREEGLRGDDARTTSRAIWKWRKRHGKKAGEPMAVQGFRIARKQPRPMPTNPSVES